jgi:hypothetical protein
VTGGDAWGTWPQATGPVAPILEPLKIFPPDWQPPVDLPDPTRLTGSRQLPTGEYLQELRAKLAKSKRALRAMQQALTRAYWQGQSTQNLRWMVEHYRAEVETIKESIGTIGIPRSTTGSQTLFGARQAGAAAAAGGGAALGGQAAIEAAAIEAQINAQWGTRLTRFAGRFGRGLVRGVFSVKVLAVIVTAAVVGGGAYAISRAASSGGETLAVEFIGPGPIESELPISCTLEVAGEYGLVWSDDRGWDLAGATRPDPEVAPWNADEALYRSDRDRYINDVNGRVYDTLQDAGTRCAPASGPTATCTPASYTGFIDAVQVGGQGVGYTDVVSEITGNLGADCSFGFHIYWVVQTNGEQPLCYALLGGGGGTVNQAGIIEGSHTLNAGSFTTPGNINTGWPSCSQHLADIDGFIGQYLGQRGNDFTGSVDREGAAIPEFSTDPDQGSPWIVVPLVFEPVRD